MISSYLKYTVFLALVCAVAVQDARADTNLEQANANIKDAFKNLGAWVVTQYTKVESFFADTKDDLKKRVNDTGNFLSDCKTNLNKLQEYATNKSDSGLQTALGKVGEFETKVKNFNSTLTEQALTSAEQVKAKTDDWKKQIGDMYNGGLDKIIKAAQDAKAGATMQKCSWVLTTVLIAFIAAVAY